MFLNQYLCISVRNSAIDGQAEMVSAGYRLLELYVWCASETADPRGLSEFLFDTGR